MKKTLFVTAVIASLMTSCKKDYTCTCTADGDTDTYPFNDAKKKDATDACDKLESDYKLLFADDATCDLK